MSISSKTNFVTSTIVNHTPERIYIAVHPMSALEVDADIKTHHNSDGSMHIVIEPKRRITQQ